MASFNGNSYTKFLTPAERRAEARAYERRERGRVAVLSRSEKTRLLARAIVEAASKRGQVSVNDGVQAGLTRREVEAFYPSALEVARRIEPRLTAMGSLS